MISKEIFARTMRELTQLYDNFETINAAVQKVCPGSRGLYPDKAFTIPLSLLGYVFNDTGEWLDYFVWDRDWLREYYDGMVRDKDGSPIDTSTWEKVYDFLIGNMEEKVKE